MRRIIFIVLVIFLSIFDAHNYLVKAAVQGQMNIDAYVDAETSGIGEGVPFIPDSAPPAIYDVQIFEITAQSARVSWKTNENSSAYLYYGKTPSYEIGILQDHPESIGLSHKIKIDGLESGIKYYFQLRSLDSAGNQGIKDGYSFITLSSFISPPNISFFIAQSQEGKIILSWKNQQSGNFSGVQINKNINSPALDPQSGEIIYSGTGENFADTSIKNGVRYFYTAFSYDSAGSFSSGVVASAVGIKTTITPIPRPAPTPIPTIPPIIPVSDVENLEAAADAENKKITIKWTNPKEENFEEVEIYKSVDFPVLAPNEGESIYKGKENNFEDADIEEDVVYYYTAFAKDKFGNYSSGVTTTGTLKKLPPPLISEINLKDISFISSREALFLPINEGNKIYVFTNSELTVYYDAKNLPQTLKTIILTIGKSSYILNSDEKKEFYRTKFISLPIAGNYPITISVLDFRAGKIFQAKAELAVENRGMVYEFKNKSDGAENILDKIVSSFKFQVSKIFNNRENLNLYKIGVKNAMVSLYKFDENSGELQIWDGKKYNQENPQTSNKDGGFGFMVPNGKYKISIQKDKYNSKEEIINVGNNLVNGEMEIEKKFDWRLVILIAAIALLILIISRKLLRRRKKALKKDSFFKN